VERLVELNFYGGNLKFSAGHFTIFNATKREHLHGHNYFLQATIITSLHEPGISFDYSIFRNKLADLCLQIHSKFLLPEQSPYLEIEKLDEHYRVTFNKKQMLLLQEDIILLPLKNITIEELSHWFWQQLHQDQAFIAQYGIQKISIQVFNGLEQSAKIHFLETSCC
jgi:6-pyruvoyltetrahydropterin/6-carboxytetrahydropterin synthase